MKNEQIDGTGRGHSRRKKVKHRQERRKAKRNPEAQATYKRYVGYES